MKRILVVFLAAVTFIGVWQGVAAAEDEECASANINAIGARKLLSNDWKPNNEQDEFGADMDIRGKWWPVSLNLGYLYSVQKGRADTILTQNNVTTAYNDLERESSTQEVYLGAKKVWMDKNNFSLFVGAGASWIKARIAYLDIQTFDETNVGWYGSLGGYYTVLRLINLGVIVRYSDNTVKLGNQDINAGGWHYGFLAGLHF